MLWALIKKEYYQIVRDPSSILIAFVLPLILLLIYMYGINLDAIKTDIGIVNEDRTSRTELLADSFQNNAYINLYRFSTREEAYQELNDSRIGGVVIIPQDFERKLSAGSGASVQLITDGSESNTANYVQNYVNAIITNWYAQTWGSGSSAGITMQTTFWYNQEMDSHYSIVPGSLAITMTLIGILLTGLVIAREMERGTFESLLASGVPKIYILLGKYIPYYLLGMASCVFNLFLCVEVFDIPFRGSYMSLFVAGTVFLFNCLGIGLFISIKMKTQLLAGQLSFMLGFLPSLLLSGLIFPIQSMAPIFQYLTNIVPARYFLVIIQNEFLVGAQGSLYYYNILYLIILGSVFFAIVYAALPKKL